MNINCFLNNVKNWAELEREIRALILVGSYARGAARADSDIDLLIITPNPHIYLQNNFIYRFGKVKNSENEDWGLVTVIRTWYDSDVFEVEFGITTPIWVQKPLDKGTLRVLSDGYRILIDKDGYFENIGIPQNNSDQTSHLP